MMTPCVCTNLRLATRRLSARYGEALAPSGVNIAQYFLLRVIAEYAPISLTELGRLTELDRSTVGRNIRVLERLQIVDAARGEADQREALVSLTPQGKTLLHEATLLWAECQNEVSARLGADNVAALEALLAKI